MTSLCEILAMTHWDKNLTTQRFSEFRFTFCHSVTFLCDKGKWKENFFDKEMSILLEIIEAHAEATEDASNNIIETRPNDRRTLSFTPTHTDYRGQSKCDYWVLCKLQMQTNKNANPDHSKASKSVVNEAGKKSLPPVFMNNLVLNKLLKVVGGRWRTTCHAIKSGVAIQEN